MHFGKSVQCGKAGWEARAESLAQHTGPEGERGAGKARPQLTQGLEEAEVGGGRGLRLAAAGPGPSSPTPRSHLSSMECTLRPLSEPPQAPAGGLPQMPGNDAIWKPSSPGPDGLVWLLAGEEPSWEGLVRVHVPTPRPQWLHEAGTQPAPKSDASELESNLPLSLGNWCVCGCVSTGAEHPQVVSHFPVS